MEKKNATKLDQPLFCPKCEHLRNTEVEGKCPVCGEELSSYPNEEPVIRAASRNAHNDDIAGYNRSQNALCFLVIGGIVFIIGLLFIVLALRREFNEISGINVASLAFVISMICLALGAASLVYGAINLILALKTRKQARIDIAIISSWRSEKKEITEE